MSVSDAIVVGTLKRTTSKMGKKKPIQPILAIRQLHFEPGDMLVIFTDARGYSDDSMGTIRDILKVCNNKNNKDVPVLILHGQDADKVHVQQGHEGQIPVMLNNLEYLTLMRERKVKHHEI